MDPRELEAAYRNPSPEATLDRLIRRFRHALNATRDVDSGMAAVNELLERPLTYVEFAATVAR